VYYVIIVGLKKQGSKCAGCEVTIFMMRRWETL